jgi:V/A-type H+-transporting ATPase subunit E
MTDPKSAPDLEAALLDRAKRLADEYLAKGRNSREAILNEERERLRTREERITDEARSDADRILRRRVQAAQLRLQGSLDRERWDMIQSIVDELPDRLNAIANDPERYEALLLSLLAKAAESIGEDNLVASFNARDLKKLKGRWNEFVEKAAPGKTIKLDPEPIECGGGMCVTNQENRVSVDATFEGRGERFRDELIQAIAERLFSRAGAQAG